MTASLRTFARSRSLRALGLVAWLMLVFSALATAAPVGMGEAHADAMHAMAAAAGEPSHHGHAHHDHHASSHECCDPHAGGRVHAGHHACDCVGTCASAVPPAPGRLTLASWVSRGYTEPVQLHAPSAPVSPPLRPPSA